MNEVDLIDVITIAFIVLPVLVASLFARSYVKTKTEIEQYSKHLSNQLSIDEKFIIENSQDGTLTIKLLVIYVILGAFSFQVYDINPMFAYIVPVVSVIVVFGFYGRNSGIDENDAALLVVRMLEKISMANRIGNLDKVKKLSLISDYIIASFKLNKTGENFVSSEHISFVDTLNGSQRTEYIAKNFITKIYLSLKVLVPVVIAVAVAVLIKAAF
jgi:hypothetical protein